MSVIRRLNFTPRMKLVREDLTAVVEKGEGKVWINESEGIFEYPYKTDVVIARRK